MKDVNYITRTTNAIVAVSSIVMLSGCVPNNGDILKNMLNAQENCKKLGGVGEARGVPPKFPMAGHDAYFCTIPGKGTLKVIL